jgi:hypothetical protein
MTLEDRRGRTELTEREKELDEALNVANGILSALLRECGAIPRETLGGVVTGIMAGLAKASIDETRATVKRAIDSKDLDVCPYQKLSLRRHRKAPWG